MAEYLEISNILIFLQGTWILDEKPEKKERRKERRERMDKYLHTYANPKLSQEDINHLNRSLTHNEIEAVIEDPPKKSRTWWILHWILPDLQRRTIPTLLKLFHEIKREETLPNSFYEVCITLIQNWTRTQQKRELQVNLFNEHRWKNLQ
jgi:hypothetical protein